MKDKGRKQSGQAADRSWELRPYSTVSSGFRLELLARRAVLGRFSRWGALAQPECPQGGILLRGDPPPHASLGGSRSQPPHQTPGRTVSKQPSRGL